MEDYQIRLAAFNWLKSQLKIRGETIPREVLRTQFYYKNTRIPLVSPQGIFKPKVCNLPLTIASTPEGPYDDGLDYSGYLRYKYRGVDINHRDNVGLRKLMETNTPLIYLLGIVPGKYLPLWPVYIIGDDQENLTFTVAVDTELAIPKPDMIRSDEDNSRRSYITSQIKVRLHQCSFREKVIRAYRQQCAFCRLKHVELLDAAHIIPDSDPLGKPIVTNGLSLCKIHHAAFDRFFIGVTPDYHIIIRKDILEEEDGPMLKYGLQEMHKKKIILPSSESDWPNPEFLGNRYNEFIEHV